MVKSTRLKTNALASLELHQILRMTLYKNDINVSCFKVYSSITKKLIERVLKLKFRSFIKFLSFLKT